MCQLLGKMISVDSPKERIETYEPCEPMKLEPSWKENNEQTKGEMAEEGRNLPHFALKQQYQLKEMVPDFANRFGSLWKSFATLITDLTAQRGVPKLDSMKTRADRAPVPSGEI